MFGKLFGVGVGPGDPELLTLKAVRVLEECDILAIPSKEKETCTAYQIAKKACPFIDKKEILSVDMPMTKDPVRLEESHQAGACSIEEKLKAGLSVAFLTLGDPCVYSTYLYVHKKVADSGYQTEIVNGIPSFCAAAAKLNIGLVEKEQPLLIIPGSYPIKDLLSLPGTKVLMKSGRKMGQVKEALEETDLKVSMVENCGMEDEKIYQTLSDIPEQSGYFSLIIAKESSN